MLFTKLSLFYFFYFSLLGIMAPYMGLYLEDRGFSLLEIAELTSILMMTKIIAPNVWGYLGDHFHCRLKLVRYGAFATLLCFVAFFTVDTFWEYALVIVVFSFFWNAVLPQFEVTTLYNLSEQKERYSRVRLWGSIGFILSVVLCGWLFDQFGLSLFAWVMLTVIIAIWLSSLVRLEEPQPPRKPTSKNKGIFLREISRPFVLAFFIVCFLLQVSHGSYYTYFSIFLESEGYTKAQIGVLWSLGVIAEVILFVLMHRWIVRHSVSTIILIALSLTVLRWGLTAELAGHVTVLVFAQCLHAFSFGAMHAASIHFVHSNFSSHNQGKAQALYSSVGFGAGGASGAYASGVIVSEYSYSVAFWLSAMVALLGVIIIAAFRLKKINNEIG